VQLFRQPREEPNATRSATSIRNIPPSPTGVTASTGTSLFSNAHGFGNVHIHITGSSTENHSFFRRKGVPNIFLGGPIDRSAPHEEHTQRDQDREPEARSQSPVTDTAAIRFEFQGSLKLDRHAQQEIEILRRVPMTYASFFF
jgi:hypothetical protein